MQQRPSLVAGKVVAYFCGGMLRFWLYQSNMLILDDFWYQLYNYLIYGFVILFFDLVKEEKQHVCWTKVDIYLHGRQMCTVISSIPQAKHKHIYIYTYMHTTVSR